MYTINFNGLPIYDPRVEAYNVRDPGAHLAVGEPGSLEFTIDSDHSNADQITKRRGTLELKEDDVVVFRGRVIKDITNFDLSRTVSAEGQLACLNDSLIPPYAFPEDFLDDPDYLAAAESGNVVEFFLGWLIAQHNAQVLPEQQIKLGAVTVTDPNNYITRSSSDYSCAWKVIKEKLAESSLGGYILPRYEQDGTYIDYFADFPLTNIQPVEFAGNLLDLTNEADATDVFSVILPVGAEGLTIESLPDGEIGDDLVKEGKVIYSKAMISAYGRSTHFEKWDDVAQPENLKTKAAARLAAAGLSRTITVKACDLHYEGQQSFRVGRYTRLTSKPHGISAVYPLMELDINILDPGATEITLGEVSTTQSELNRITASQAADRADKLQLEIGKQAEHINGVSQGVTEQISAAIQNSQSIILQALEGYVQTGDLESYKEIVSAQLAVMADQITMDFTTMTETVESVNGDLQSRFSNLSKYIRFSGDGIEIGADENSLKLTLDNDNIQFTSNGLPVGWWDGTDFHTGNIVVEVNERAQFGEFAFIPRSDGSLMFLKVGGA